MRSHKQTFTWITKRILGQGWGVWFRIHTPGKGGEEREGVSFKLLNNFYPQISETLSMWARGLQQ